MRCKECNVDLGEEYTVCPLCGAQAVDEPPRLEGMRTSEYPPVYSRPDRTEPPEKKYGLSVQRLKAYFFLRDRQNKK